MQTSDSPSTINANNEIMNPITPVTPLPKKMKKQYRSSCLFCGQRKTKRRNEMLSTTTTVEPISTSTDIIE